MAVTQTPLLSVVEGRDYFRVTDEMRKRYESALGKKCKYEVARVARDWNSPYTHPGGYMVHGRWIYFGDFMATDRFSIPYTDAERMQVDVVSAEDLPEMPFAERLRATALPVTSSGWDPEIFVVDERGGLLPAFAFLPSEKEAEAIDVGRGTMAKAYWDGFQAEFNTFPDSCHGRGIDYLRSGLRQVQIAATRVQPKAKLTLKSFFEIEQGMLDTLPEEHVALGCNPSLNAYGLEPLVFTDPRKVRFRCAGGHIHFGGDITGNVTRYIKTLDKFLAIPCVALFDGLDDPRRREYYGRAGEFRQPKYGIEYRVLSNAWLAHPAVAHMVMNLARGVMRLRGWDPLPNVPDGEVQEIINEANGPRARAFVEANWPMIGAIGETDQRGNAFARAKRMFLGGMANELKNFDKIEANWSLDGQWAYHSNGDRMTWSNWSAREYAR